MEWLGDLGTALGAQLLDWVLPSLATLIGGYVVRVLSQQAKRLGIQITAEQEAQIKEAVKTAVLAVEELARRVPMSGEEKAQVATAKLRRELPEVPESRIAELVDAALPVVRAEITPVVEAPAPSLPIPGGASGMHAAGASAGLPGGGRR